MNETVQDHLAELDRLCRYYQVRRLDLFGSAAAAGTRPGDLDFLVEFEELEPDAYADAISDSRMLWRRSSTSRSI